MFSFLKLEITSQSLPFLPQLADLEIGLLAHASNLHLKLADFVILLLTELLKLPNF